MPPSDAGPRLEEVLFFHTVSIRRYGGSSGVRDEGSLLAAIQRPWQASFGKEHFPSPFERAAALMESVIRRHPFVDGNKRTAVASAAYLLSGFGYRVKVEQELLEDFAVGVAEGNYGTEEIARWFQDHSVRS